MCRLAAIAVTIAALGSLPAQAADIDLPWDGQPLAAVSRALHGLPALVRTRALAPGDFAVIVHPAAPVKIQGSERVVFETFWSADCTRMAAVQYRYAFAFTAGHETVAAGQLIRPDESAVLPDPATLREAIRAVCPASRPIEQVTTSTDEGARNRFAAAYREIRGACRFAAALVSLTGLVFVGFLFLTRPTMRRADANRGESPPS
ncbi:hypothetical protein AQ915_20720 [Burkholderia pseudomallei]|uniref:hypothetical protein n=1 Tax=Burkholderia pseudomallei TaxID=28450 RepID=UPI000978042C|nr:hypothetical protein [Burkholderia pseudomallei]ONC30079.1 hypothetical protein AQ915_20720 [Burkholderia pseudomallei]